MFIIYGLNATPFGENPNIILVITDDQGYGPVGKHGHPWIKTPNLDKLHGQSIRFERFFVSPTCSPTRAALMSGRHPMKNGITHTILERERMALSTVTLPQVLAKAGYSSGIFGKWHLGDEEPYQPHKRRFDEAFIHGAGGLARNLIVPVQMFQVINISTQSFDIMVHLLRQKVIVQICFSLQA